MAGTNVWPVGTAPTAGPVIGAPAVSVPGPVGWFQVTNGTGATAYLISGTQGTTSNGYPLGTSPTSNPPNTVSGYLFSGDSFYCITASGTSTINVIQTGV